MSITNASSAGGADVLVARGLTKRYGARVAVDALDLTVRRGSITGFLGPNGAGKTTTLRMFLGLVKPTAGSAHVCGVDVGGGARLPADKIGALIENPAAWAWLSADDVLRVCALTSGRGVTGRIDRARRLALLDRCGLAGRHDDIVRGFSLGMKQRLALAAALSCDPEVLILDEPMNGLDPVGVTQMRELLASLRDEGRTLIVSSHQLSEVQQLCDDVVILVAGQKRYGGPMDGLRRTAQVRVRTTDDDAACKVLLARGFIASIVTSGGVGSGAGRAIVVDLVHDDAPGVARAVVEVGLGLLALEPVGFDLEQAFLDVVSA